MSRAVSIFTFAGQFTVITALAALLFNPWTGLVYGNPMAAFGAGLLGFGLCKFARERLAEQD